MSEEQKNIFCQVCGNKLEPGMQNCPVCGTAVGGATGQASQAVNPVTNPMPADAPTAGTPHKVVPIARIQINDESLSSNFGDKNHIKGKKSKRKWMYVIGGIIVIFAGLVYIGNQDNQKQEVSSAPATSSQQVKQEKTLTAQERAAQELESYGYSNAEVLATSYGHSGNGFLSVLGGKEYRLVLVDRKNQRAAVITPIRKDEIRNFASKDGGLMQIGNQLKGTIIAEFAISNDVQDQDVEAGNWSGATHQIPIYCDYKVTNSGVIEPGKLTTGKGLRPSHYQDYLYEQKNVDMANLFLMELLPLKENMKQNQVNFF